MKTILAVWHAGSKGKSSVLRQFAVQLLHAFPDYEPVHPGSIVIPENGDFTIVVKLSGRVIGIASEGDPKSGLENRLNELVKKYACDVILCSCRTRGETPQAVDHVASSNGFSTIWVSTYQIAGESQQQSVNRLQGKHLLELLKELGLV